MSAEPATHGARAPAPGSRPAGPSGFQSLFSVGRGTAVMVIGTATLFGFSFLSRVFIARSFSLTDWGEFSLGLALQGFLSYLALLGLDQAIARSLSYERDLATRRAIVRNGIAVAVAGAAIVSLTVYLLAAPIAQLFRATGFVWIIRVLSIAVGFQVLNLVVAALFLGFEDAAPNAVFNQMLNPGLFVAFIAAAIVFHIGFFGVIVSYSLASAVTFAALVGYSLAKLPGRLPPAPGPSPPVPQLWNLTVALWGVGTLQFVTAFVDTLILGVYRPATDVGLYSAGMTLARVLLVGNGALTYIYLPVAARLARDRDFRLLQATYVAGTRWILLIVTPALLLFLFLPGLSMTAIFGPSFGVGAPTLAILAACAFGSVVVGPANSCLAGLGEARMLFLTTGISAAANVLLSVVLIPLYGGPGASVAWGVARVAYPGLGWLILYQLYGVLPFQRTLVRPLLFALAVGAPLFVAIGLAHPPAWIVFPLFVVGVGLYALGLVVTRSLVPGDLAAARALEAVLGRPLPGLRRLLERFVVGSPSAPGGPGGA
jgi:O-antigen/teichoic acid export membrane protein